MLRTLRLATLLSVGLFAASPTNAQNQGLWETPFNHVVPTNWQAGQPGWDGEPISPYANLNDLHRFMAGHMALIPVGPERGKVLVWDWMRIFTGKQYWSIIDPVTRTFQNFELTMPPGKGDLFCSGHSWSKDGHLVVAGGDRFVGGQLMANDLCFRVDPTAPVGNAWWVREPDMNFERWYPTVTTLGTDNGGKDHVVVTGGLGVPPFSETTYEAFDPTGAPGAGTWQPNPNNPGNAPYFAGPPVPIGDSFFVYPRQTLLTSGKMFQSGFPYVGYRVQHNNIALGSPPVWDVQAFNPSISRYYGSSVLFPNEGGPGAGLEDIVLRLGGEFTFTGTPFATNTMEISFAGLPTADPNWNWILGPSMANAREYTDATLLPDATIFVSGGKQDVGAPFSTALPVLQAELFNDTFATWRTVASAQTRRGYHSTAALLPDGRVLIGGGEQREMDYEIYQPPYLTNGTVRPSFVNPPSTLTMPYGTTHSLQHHFLPDDVKVQRVVLIAPASITHHSDMHQRYVEMKVVGGSGNSVRFQAPPSSNHAPKGYYMLFLVTNPQGTNARGTPSVATWVKLQ